MSKYEERFAAMAKSTPMSVFSASDVGSGCANCGWDVIVHGQHTHDGIRVGSECPSRGQEKDLELGNAFLGRGKGAVETLEKLQREAKRRGAEDVNPERVSEYGNYFLWPKPNRREKGVVVFSLTDRKWGDGHLIVRDIG